MRWLKRLGLGVLVVVLVLAALWTWSRLRGPTPEQRAALARWEAPNAFAGRNAFDAVWVLRYDVPDADVASVADADMKALAEASRQRKVPASFTSAAARYPDLNPRGRDVQPCGFNGLDCLEKVDAALDEHAALVRANARLIQRVEALSAYDHHAWRLPPDPNVPAPSFSLLGWPLTAHAVRFAKGDQLDAVAATCRDLAAWRRIGVQSDTLIMRMMGIALTTDGYGALLARMMAHLPRDMPLPSRCRAALAAPIAAEGSICPAMRGELAWSMGIAEWMPEMREHNAWSWLVLDREGYRAIVAEQMFAPCAAQSLTLQTDQRPSFSTGPVPIWRRFECIANSAGCILGDTIGTAYDLYALRAQDQNARLQVLATLAWLREQPDTGTLAERLARRPEDLRSPARDITVTADGRSLEIPQYDTSRGATWSLPLPPYLVESTATSD
ncbi:conserved hypothetical protein [Luteimonas sp. 9C]|uniref:hypothetical protein n=1 Tax=Luteimonas sp. 9C TaxID=2653148 RepID=UPI0012F13E45|nr:hypothetical protein [Luteimonas sp. 9C]VXB51663.1 conserved hypothetical protein [Luteimonas sp. 9C]